MKKIHVLIYFLLCLAEISHAQYAKILDFEGVSNGRRPWGDLLSDGTFLYGMTFEGGTSNSCSDVGCGVIFKIKPDGTGYLKLLDFDGTANGRLPLGSLISDGTFLYGMTYNLNGWGNIFKIKPDGTGFATLLNFDGTTHGGAPSGSLIYDGTFLYGMTKYGGTGTNCGNLGCGAIFKIKPDGTSYSKLLDFDSTATGSNPEGSLISDGTFLYGMTESGGANGLGTIFKIKTDGTGFTKLLDFSGVATGGNPHGSLFSDGTFLYGMTWIGGTTNAGVLFKIKTDGTGFLKLLDWGWPIGGQNPYGSLISDGTFLYGMTTFANLRGNMFKIKTDGTGFAQMHGFTGYPSDGENPIGSLIFDGTAFYGVTSEGGAKNFGTIFRYCIAPLTFTQSPAICAGKSVTVGTHTYTTAGTYTDTLTSHQGCDSIVTTHLTVNPLPTVTAHASAGTVCAGSAVTLTGGGASSYVWTGGVKNGVAFIPTTTATYTVTGTDANNCSNTATKKITVNPLPLITTHLSGFIITANQSGAMYQWLDCNKNNAPIAGATNQSFTATINGNYAVIITLNGCAGTSSCVNVNNIGIDKAASSNNEFTVFPNPASNSVTIKFSSALNNELLVIIKNELGQTVYSESKKDFSGKYVNTIDLGKEAKGIYFVEIVLGNERSSKKIILE